MVMFEFIVGPKERSGQFHGKPNLTHAQFMALVDLIVCVHTTLEREEVAFVLPDMKERILPTGLKDASLSSTASVTAKSKLNSSSYHMPISMGMTKASLKGTHSRGARNYAWICAIAWVSNIKTRTVTPSCFC